MSALMFYDAEFGALAVFEHREGLLTLDHGFDESAFDAALEVLERHARPAFRDDGTALWRTTSHRKVVIASLTERMEREGFGPDPLGLRSALEVDESEAREPDLPVSGRPARLHEAVERGLHAHIDVGMSTLRSRGNPQLVESRHLPRRGTDSMRRPLFLTRFRGLILGPVESAADTQAALREGLSPLGEIVRRACVFEANLEDGTPRHGFEIAIAPTREVIESYVQHKLPTFEGAGAVVGVRPARFILNALLSSEDIAKIEERAAACTAATSLARPNGRTVVARVPCGISEGAASGDIAFSRRISWLARELSEYSPCLDYVGEVEQTVPLGV